MPADRPQTLTGPNGEVLQVPDQRPHERKFASISVGSPKADVERLYGPPRDWLWYYDAGLASFREDRLSSVSAHRLLKTWPRLPIDAGMSRAALEALIGKPTEECIGSYYVEGMSHFFCYRQGKLVRKERMVAVLL